MKIPDIISNSPQGLFSVVGELKWLDYGRSVNVRGQQKRLCEGRIVDDSSKQMNITIWGEELIDTIEENHTYQFKDMALSWWNGNVRMGTTSTTSISDAPSQSFDWSKDLTMLQNSKICCPIIVSARLNCFLSCPDQTCRKKMDLADEIIEAYLEWKEAPTNENRDVKCNSCQGLTVF